MSDTKQMSKTERQTLIRLVKQRFKLLETGLAARRSQLQRVTQQEIIAESKDEAEKYRQRVADQIIEPMTELLRAYEAIKKEAEDAGFETQGYALGNAWNYVNQARQDRSVFVPKDLHNKVNDRMLEKLGDKPMSRYALELEESKLVEELLVGDLGSDDAKAFLDQIPTLEGMIPLPNGGANKALLMGEDA